MGQSKQFNDASHALNDLSHAVAVFEAENASLRKLGRSLAEAAGVMVGGCSVLCSRAFGCDGNPVPCPAEERMRELGIEVGA